MRVDLAGIWVGRGEGKLQTCGDLRAHLFTNPSALLRCRNPLRDQPCHQDLQRIALSPPPLLLIFGPVVPAVDISNMVPQESIGLAQQERRALAPARPRHGPARSGMDGAHILTVHLLSYDAERPRPRQKIARSRLGIGRVLVVEVVFTDENDGKRPQRGHVHHFVENPLAQSALAEEADRYPVAPRALGGKGRARGNPGTTGHDGVGPQVAALLVGDVHRSALPAAIPRRLAQELGEHPVYRRPLGQTVAVAGSGTDVCRPSSSARLRSFCIIVTSNHASSGIRSTNGPRYFNIGDAITLLSSTATAVSRGIPPFSASATPSLKASICTARLRFVAIFMSTAWPFPPT